MSQSDELAIHRLKHEYCYAIDDGHYDDWVSLFTRDGRFVRDGDASYEGHEELGEMAEGFAAAFDHSAHVVSNSVIDVDGESATGRWYLLLFYRLADGEEGWRQGVYTDCYRLVDGAWKIEETAVSYGIENQL